MPQRMEFGFSFGPSDSSPSKKRGPMRLLLLGDFSAKPASQRPPLTERPSHRVDLDNLDRVMLRLAPQFKLAAGDIGFESIDDFHPEQLYARLQLFQDLREARSRPIESGSAPGLLDQLLGKSTTSTEARPGPNSLGTAQSGSPGLDNLIRKLVAPHIVPDQTAGLQAQHAAVDSVITEQMRRLLHDPAFQSLEAAWRGVQWLIANLELDDQLELHLFDVSREELLADIVASKGQLARTGLHHALADRWRNLPGGQSWSALVGLYQFGASDADVGLLAALGLLASQAGGPLLAGGDPGLAALESSQQGNWQALRQSEAAPWIGLAAPRVLLRLPYGKKSDPVAGFAFEEFDASPVHEEFLWGNGALAVALLIGRSFNASGWDFEPGDEREIGGLPAFTFLHDGERELQACAERFMSEEAGQAMLAAGLMPLMSHRHSNAITVMRMQTVAEPATKSR
ncbi:type VI secretion system contractile sheath domain-containing protein [Roseateles oligotrophus]|uniref:Type VI secretion system contractile sheath large subunit n=1 Tax=Roseateles oligotrophus TaxID=1769250 RepID=A0ABT2YG89_9BURK|nr:type VI secretion system contractile sheath large subunit [Roseateles oligotrophus]MCV2369028.1 type VI secretion system contractile sheath large subunit [Roseateles oligotrophus]